MARVNTTLVLEGCINENSNPTQVFVEKDNHDDFEFSAYPDDKMYKTILFRLKRHEVEDLIKFLGGYIK